MSGCSICSPSERAIKINIDLSSGELTQKEVAEKYGINFHTLRGHVKKGHTSIGPNRNKELVTSSKKEQKSTSLKWGKNGEGSVIFSGGQEIPNDSDIKALLRHVGKNPDDYNWEVVSVSWNSSSWHRAEEVAAQSIKHSAFSAPSCVVKIKIEPKSESRNMTVEIRQAPPIKINVASTNKPLKRRISDLKCAVIYADSQIWYWKDQEGIWHPTHDEAALDVGLQITGDVDAEHGIDVMVDLGDLVDFPVVSNHPSPLAMTLHESTNLSIARSSRLMAERTAVSLNAKKRRWLRGNHEQRWSDWLANNAPHLVGLQRAGEMESTPVLSLQYLTRSDELGWTLGERSYPNDVFWLNDNTRCIHGTVGKSQVGDTLKEYLKEEVNTIAGHTPHAGIAYNTIARQNGPRTYVACTPGGFMRRDGKVPSRGNKNTDLGQPSESDGNRWEQGMAIVFYSEDGKTVPQIEHIPIFNGRAVWRGKLYTARCDIDGNII